MTGLPLALALAIVVGVSAPRPTPPAPRTGEPEEEERVERPVRFEAPAAEMRKLSAVVGAWSFEEVWTEPARYKRGDYEGWPGPGGEGTLTIRPGPGEFSILCDYDARNPMGHVTALAVVAWNPSLRVYEYDEIHSAFPGVLHLTGRFEGSDLVFRGKDPRQGAARSVRLVWKGLGQEAWSARWSEADGRGRMEPVVAMELRRAPAR